MFLFRDGTKAANGEYKAGCMTYAEIKKKGEGVYMRRWYLLYFPKFFSVRVHHIRLPDVDRWPHDHPWHFVSIILRGGYKESWCRAEDFRAEVPDNRVIMNKMWRGYLTRHVKRISFHRNTDLHKINTFDRGDKGAWSLIFTTGNKREWGFATDKGWVDRKDLNLGNAVGAGEPD